VRAWPFRRLAVVLSCGLLLTACALGGQQQAGSSPGNKPRPSTVITDADVLLIRDGLGIGVIDRYAPGDPDLAEMGLAVVKQLGFQLEGAGRFSAQGSGGGEQGLAQQLRRRLAVAFSREVTGAPVDSRELRSAGAELQLHLGDLVDDADGQAALALFALLARRLHEPVGIGPAACRLARSRPVTRNWLRQWAVLDLVQPCADVEIDPGLWRELQPTSLSGCPLFLRFVGLKDGLDRAWAEACWQDAYAFLLQGHDERALSDLMIASETAPARGVVPDEARRLMAVAAARYARFGGGVSGFQGLGGFLRARSYWTARQLLPQATAPVEPLLNNPVSHEPDDVLSLAAAGLLPRTDPLVAKALARSQDVVTDEWNALVARQDQRCSGFRPKALASHVGSLPVTPRGILDLADVLDDVALERLVTCHVTTPSVSAIWRGRVARLMTEATKAATSKNVEQVNSLAQALCTLAPHQPLPAELSAGVRLLGVGSERFDVFEGMPYLQDRLALTTMNRSSCSQGLWWLPDAR
jgi:hypothetical protein